MTSYTDLDWGKEYYIKSYDGKYFKGMKFHDYQTSFKAGLPLFHDVNMIFERSKNFYSFHEEDYYYDPEKIRENAQKARQQMESRALNKILKQIVNETFYW